ncbi:MAG: hypothetical protein JXR49_00640 [Acidobacteria bacterium]|nr:hypothetical protein [Acidobacteriota bacterium]
MKVEEYEFGRIRIDGREYRNDVIVFLDRVSPEWWRKDGHSLAVEDLKEVLQYNPDLLIVGRGAYGVMRIPGETREALREKHIQLIDDITGQAVQLFNERIEKGEKAVGAFHLTC